MRRHPVGDDQCGHHERHDEQEEPEPEDGPVESHPDVGVDGPHGTDRGQGGQRHGDPHGQDRPGRDGAQDAEEPVGHGHGRPGSQGADDRGLLGVATDQTADHLSVDHEGG